MARYLEANSHELKDGEKNARCETVLNVTMAELDVCHDQKAEDFKHLAIEFMDGEIEIYEKVGLRNRI